MKQRWIVAALAAVSGSVVVGCSRAIAQQSEGTSPGREVELLVYSGNFGMVQETRQIDVAKGVGRVGLSGVSKSLDQHSVIFYWPDRKDAQVRASTYDLGMDESGDLLKRFLGREVELVYRSQNGREGDRVRGTLEVADPGNIVVKADGRYIVNPDATIETPSDEGIVTIPQLSAEVEAASAGPAKLAVSYLTEGIGWSADYTLNLPRGASPASFECWASVTNRTGTDFPNAKLKFVAGSPNRAVVREEARAWAVAGAVAADFNDSTLRSSNGMYRGGAGRMPAIESVGELHAYPYEAKATIRQDQVNRVRMMGADGVVLKRWYAIDMPVVWRDGYYGNPDQRLKATLGVNLKNDEASKLGQPLPGGAVRVYEPDANGRPQFIGAATIRDTPKDARVSLTLSNVFDVYAQAKVLKTQKVGKRKVRKTFEVVVHNEKDAEQEVRLVQNFYGTYSIVSESAKSVKLNAGQRQWSISVPAGGETKLKFVVEL